MPGDQAEGRRRARGILESLREKDPYGRLPSARACQAQWGLSEATFRRARQDLERDSGPAGTKPYGKWTQLVEKIKKDIASGKLRPGERLDSGAAAAARCAASHPTLRKALRHLIKEGVLLEIPRGAEVPRPRLVPGTRILLVRSCGADGLVVGEAERMARFRREVELHAHKSGVSLEVWGYAGDDRFFHDGSRISNPRSRISRYHGAILSFWDVDDCDGMLGAFQKTPIPVSVWDERPQGGGFDRSPLLRYFSSSYSSEAGEIMARHLADKGHRHVAYLSPLHGSLWSRARLEGIRETAASREMRVTECVAIEVASHRGFEPPETITEKYLKVQALRRHLGNEISRGVDEIQERLAILLRLRRMLDRLSPLFAQAQESRATAWICANDDVALLAWAWLSRQGVEIPSSSSLVGFDDTLGAQSASLTSFHFNEGDLAAAALRHVLSPKRLRTNESSGRHTHVPGFVVARSSVATLSKSGQSA